MKTTGPMALIIEYGNKQEHWRTVKENSAGCSVYLTSHAAHDQPKDQAPIVLAWGDSVRASPKYRSPPAFSHASMTGTCAQ